MGDLGISTVIIKSHAPDRGFELHRKAGITLTGEPLAGPDGSLCYPVRAPYGNMFLMEEDSAAFLRTSHPTGGVKGSIIGVSDIEKSIALYGDVLGYNKVIFDVTGVPGDLTPFPGSDGRFRRVRLVQSDPGAGGFAPMLGTGCIELIQALDFKQRKIFEGRYWGDKGYIHLCLDVRGMDALKGACENAGFPFTVDSKDAFDMGDANGRFAYTEDPDGTLVELVEAFTVPLVKKLGLYLNLEKRDPAKPIPKWMLKTLRFSRVKDRG
jgi:catechol 2,3-dioxygenase-like lactoylglutathione lyase family enzyme